MLSEPNVAARPVAGKERIVLLDAARGIALLAMATYHFTWDLEFFGYVTPGMTAIGGWKLFARCIASSFLFLVGVSLFLAHGEAIRWPGFARRFAMVAGAAALITIATRIFTPDSFIFFGILHEIALASLLGLALLRLPFAVNLLLAAAIVAGPFFLRAPAFDHPTLWWLGLAPVNPRSNDYVPLFPWFGAVVAGIAAAQVATATGLRSRLAGYGLAPPFRPVAVLGRHSLLFYLVHQPVLVACIWLFSQIVPATPIPAEARFLPACQATCGQSRDAEFCARYCLCMRDRLASSGDLPAVMTGSRDEILQSRLGLTAEDCAAEVDGSTNEEPTP